MILKKILSSPARFSERGEACLWLSALAGPGSPQSNPSAELIEDISAYLFPSVPQSVYMQLPTVVGDDCLSIPDCEMLLEKVIEDQYKNEPPGEYGAVIIDSPRSAFLRQLLARIKESQDDEYSLLRCVFAREACLTRSFWDSLTSAAHGLANQCGTDQCTEVPMTALLASLGYFDSETPTLTIFFSRALLVALECVVNERFTQYQHSATENVEGSRRAVYGLLADYIHGNLRVHLLELSSYLADALEVALLDNQELDEELSRLKTESCYVFPSHSPLYEHISGDNIGVNIQTKVYSLSFMYGVIQQLGLVAETTQPLIRSRRPFSALPSPFIRILAARLGLAGMEERSTLMPFMRPLLQQPDILNSLTTFFCESPASNEVGILGPILVEWYGLEAFLDVVINPSEDVGSDVDFPVFLGIQSDVGAHNMQVMHRLRRSGVLTIKDDLSSLSTGRDKLYRVLYACLFFDKFSETERSNQLTYFSSTLGSALFFFRHSLIDKLEFMTFLIRTGLFMSHLSSLERSECFSHLQSLGASVWTRVATELKPHIPVSDCYKSLVLFSIAYPILSKADRFLIFVHHFKSVTNTRRLKWFWSHFPGDLHDLFFQLMNPLFSPVVHSVVINKYKLYLSSLLPEEQLDKKRDLLPFILNRRSEDRYLMRELVGSVLDIVTVAQLRRLWELFPGCESLNSHWIDSEPPLQVLRMLSRVIPLSSDVPIVRHKVKTHLMALPFLQRIQAVASLPDKALAFLVPNYERADLILFPRLFIIRTVLSQLHALPELDDKVYLEGMLSVLHFLPSVGVAFLTDFDTLYMATLLPTGVVWSSVGAISSPEPNCISSSFVFDSIMLTVMALELLGVGIAYEASGEDGLGVSWSFAVLCLSLLWAIVSKGRSAHLLERTRAASSGFVSYLYTLLWHMAIEEDAGDRIVELDSSGEGEVVPVEGELVPPLYSISIV